MELEGSLAASSVPEVLQFLNMGRKNGVLRLQHEDMRSELNVLRGKITSSRSSHRDMRIGELLVRGGYLAPADLWDALEEQKTNSEEQTIGQLLIARGLITKEALAECLSAQVEEEVWTLFSWTDGQFRFENRSEEELQPVDIEIEIDGLIMDGARRVDEWQVISHVIAGDDVVLGARLPSDGYVATSLEETATAPKPIGALTDDMWRVLAAVDGLASVGTLPRRAGMSRFDSYQVVYRLIQAGYLQVKGDLSSGGIEAPDFDGVGLAVAEPSATSGETGGFFARFGKQSAPTSRAAVGTTPGLVAEFVNGLIESYARNDEEQMGDWDVKFLVAQWQLILNRYPRADLTRATSRGLDTSRLDRQVEVCGGVTDETRACVEDTVAAMREYLSIVYPLISQRAGKRMASRLVTAELQRCENITVTHSRDADSDLNAVVRSATGVDGGAKN